jgi:hypothetical protein
MKLPSSFKSFKNIYIKNPSLINSSEYYKSSLLYPEIPLIIFNHSLNNNGVLDIKEILCIIFKFLGGHYTGRPRNSSLEGSRYIDTSKKQNQISFQ